MGNTHTKEARSASQRERALSDSGPSPYGGRESSRHHRSSRADLSFLGIGSSSERDLSTLEARRETKQDREARRLERERIAREKERERSMKEEHVDGGYLVTQGVYVGPEDFNKAVVRQLMIERRLAPFWRGLRDFSESWTEHQLVAAARGLPIPPADQIPPEIQDAIPKPSEQREDSADKSSQYLKVPDVPMGSSAARSLPSPPSPVSPSTPSSAQSRGRSKTLVSLTGCHKGSETPDSGPREVMLPHDPFVNGQPIEAYLYKDASECPICFLYYPPYLNRTRCCDQPICSECFVQIKRPDPHLPDHADHGNNSENGASREQHEDWELVSEPAACPFCVQPEFGVTYSPPPFRRGLVYPTLHGLRPDGAASPVSSTSSLTTSSNLAPPPPPTGRRRATSLSANDPSVVTTDMIRPDWAQKLANARAHAARRSAAATALHTAAYLMNPPGDDSRGSGRRSILRRTGGGSSSGSQTPVRTVGGSSALQALAYLSERRGMESSQDPSLAPPRQSSRRSRLEELEDMMVMEAIRLSLASEEERRRKEEKRARKEAKRKEKEAKKAEKAMRKHAVYNSNASGSATFSGDTPSRDGSSLSLMSGDDGNSSGKGKAAERIAPGATSSMFEGEPAGGSSSSQAQQESRGEVESFPSIVQTSSNEPARPSHLRHMSSASSTSSSLGDSGSPDNTLSGTPPNESSSADPLFNFRSLAAMIDDQDKSAERTEHVEDTADARAVGPSGGAPSSNADAVSSELAESAHSPSRKQSSQDNGSPLIPKEISAQSVEIRHEATT